MIAASSTPNGGHVIAADLDALLEENRELRAVNRDLEVVAYAIAHDLRAPLRTIGGFAELLVSDLGESVTVDAARDLDGIRTTVNRMQAMLMQWLSLIHKHHVDLQKQLVDVSALVESVVQELRIGHPEREVKIYIQPALAAVADEILLRELFQNLIGNAWKFTAKQLDPLIEIGAYFDRDRAVYFVRDNGIGFSESDSTRLFDPFVRLHDGQIYAGSGVGLAIAQRIVERHGGRIWANSVPAKGATFKFVLEADVARESPNS
jgi:light-regulated signal transduction histidine kinase (bacteriophytochrome)